MDTMDVLFWAGVIWGPSLVLMAYLMVPSRQSASRLENLHNDPSDEPEPSNRRDADRDQVVHLQPGFTPSSH